MNPFGILSSFLNGPVGNNLKNDPDDVRNTKTHLGSLGYVDEDAHDDFITRELDDGIKRFQTDHGLQVDGRLFPGGETEDRIVAQIEPVRRSDHDDRDNLPYMLERVSADDNATSPSPAAGSFGQPAQNVDATGRHIRDVETTPVPERKPIDTPPVPERKPETISPTKKGNEILDFIGKIESSDNYNIIVGGKEKPLTKMTIKEVRKLQQDRNDQNLGTAVGRYQIIDDKMDDLIRWMNLDENAVFDEKLQDQMGRELLRRRGFEEYKAGKITTEKFVKELSKEWASFPKDESNQSYYKGVGNNKALTDFNTVKDLLERR